MGHGVVVQDEQIGNAEGVAETDDMQIDEGDSL